MIEIIFTAIGIMFFIMMCTLFYIAINIKRHKEIAAKDIAEYLVGVKNRKNLMREVGREVAKQEPWWFFSTVTEAIREGEVLKKIAEELNKLQVK